MDKLGGSLVRPITATDHLYLVTLARPPNSLMSGLYKAQLDVQVFNVTVFRSVKPQPRVIYSNM